MEDESPAARQGSSDQVLLLILSVTLSSVQGTFGRDRVHTNADAQEECIFLAETQAENNRDKLAVFNFLMIGRNRTLNLPWPEHLRRGQQGAEENNA